MPVLELYIHLPFCVKKCRYCDFLSFQDAYRQCGDEYFTALKEELKYYAAQYGNKSGHSLKSIFIGGGTPGIVNKEEIPALLDTVKAFYQVDCNCEITIETNPGVTGTDKLRVFRESGINRLSLGVQSLDDGVLKSMGRIHNSEDAVKAYEAGRKAGFENINMDLILGYPGQSVSMFRDTLTKVLALGPEHISAYSLIVEEGTALYDDIQHGRTPYPDDEEDRKMYELACEMLDKNGYGRYEISNFAKPGRESIHNLGYWTGVSYLGVGLGAASFLNGVRYKNIIDLSSYLTVKPDNMRDKSETEILSVQELMDEYMMLGFRLKNGPDPEAFREKFGKSYHQIYSEKLKKILKAGLIEPSGEGYRLSAKGLDMGNMVFGEFV